MKEVLDYIKSHWQYTIRDPQNGVPYPFTSPSIEARYKDFYYWDTYFVNKGLLLDGFENQAFNNIKNISYFIEKLGYMPNANVLLNRTQPPFFSRMVVDFYEHKKDISIIKQFLPSILKEYKFFMTRRIDKFGLNIFKADDNITQEDLDAHYTYLSSRVQEYSNDKQTQNLIAQDIIAIAESGLDFNMRFKTSYSKIAIHDFMQLDINCLMFDVENNISYLYEKLGDETNSKKFKELAEKRRTLINKYFLTPENIYLDYNYKDKCFSSIASAVSLYPYIFNISKDKEGCKKVFDQLELKYGVTVCPQREDDVFYQWDYPIVWGEFSYLIYIALKNVGLLEEAKRTKDKFVNLVDMNFTKYQKLFEKYDGLTGEVANVEYESPEMMGWTAAAYRYFSEEK